ncbi:MAG: MXAN_5187 C-terminal domain-containing protein [Myxococcota bacterium]
MEPKEFDALLSDVEVRLERLRALYEQWFQGVERLEPTVPAKELERRMRHLRKTQPHIRNTALRFRFQTLWQRYTTFQTYWRRVGRQIEEGTYRRDLMRLRAKREDRRRRSEEARRAAPTHDLDLDIDIDVDDAVAEAAQSVEQAAPAPPSPKPVTSAPVPSESRPPRSFVSPFARPKASVPPGPDPAASPAPPRPASPRKGPPPPPAAAGARKPTGPGEDRLRDIYQQYVAARKRNNERTDNVRYETLEKNIRAMVPKLQQKHEGKAIDFEIVVQNGRVGLKPVPK